MTWDHRPCRRIAREDEEAEIAGRWYDQGDADVRFEWGVSGVRQLAPTADVVVVVDVLSFTTAVEAALFAGASVLPYRSRDVSAAEFALANGARLARGRTERGLSLSPRSLREGLAAGDRVVLPSPNGSTCAVDAADAGRTVVAACLRNATAVAAWVRQRGGSVLVVGAGELWPDGSLRPAYEDLVGAGAVIARLEGRVSPEAAGAVAAWADAAGALGERLRACASGQELVRGGWDDDVQYAAQTDVSVIVPVLQGGAFRQAEPA